MKKKFVVLLFGVFCLLGLVCYYLGFGAGQASVYHKMTDGVTIDDLYKK